MRVYSLKEEPGSPRYASAHQTDYAFWQRGYEVITFAREQLSSGEFDEIVAHEAEDVVFYASLGVMNEVFERAGRPAPVLPDYPEALTEYLGRRVSSASMGEVREWHEHEPGRFPLHIKPQARKLFTGCIVETSRDLQKLYAVDSSEAVFVQDVIPMRSEWRATILRGEIVSVAHYHGEPCLFPDRETMRAAVGAFSSAPWGYAMDWAVTDDGRTVLVEVNDGFGLGNYGVKGYLYTALLECRWRQIMGLDDNGVGRHGPRR